jgi:Histidine kinase-, DNA gyrase B-, and HSP90-like ATPase/D-isomer specific 2-hydroxyacid dehydrogenase, catalytic domain/D-isomer specific 2-hydroxyacid dehydrogenase, NAD binding domain
MPSNVSSSKRSIRTLLLEGVNDSAVELFVSSDFSNIERLPKALDADGLLQAIKGVDLLGIRSRTQLTDEALAGADRLVAVGCFSVGTNQVDLDAARQRGIPVFNAPFSITRSVAELVIGEIVMLLRRIFPRSSAAHKGGWDKSATDSHEVRGRTLGIVGYGNIGSQLSTLAEGMGMKVIYYDHTVEPMIAENGNRLVVKCSSNLGIVSTDPTKLRQAALNLMSNAAKFTQDGIITLSVQRRKSPAGDWIEIQVQDTGIGIAQSDIGRLFQNFGQATRSTSNKYGGTGLGLALSQKLCALLGGSISATSELGHGSCFTIRILAWMEAHDESSDMTPQFANALAI